MGIENKIREVAELKGFSIKNLEELSEVAYGTVRRWRTLTPGLYAFIRVADVLGVSLDLLTGREINSDTEMHIFARDFAKLQESQKLLIKTNIKIFLDENNKKKG